MDEDLLLLPDPVDPVEGLGLQLRVPVAVDQEQVVGPHLALSRVNYLKQGLNGCCKLVEWVLFIH